MHRIHGIGSIHPNILTTIGNTPVVRINKLAPAGANLFAKLEAFNPLGSVKDRLALGSDRGRGAGRQPAARADGRRGDQRQHRHRPRDGLRAEGLPARHRDGGELQRRAPPPDSIPRGEGGADAGGREGLRHAGEGDRAFARSTDGSCAGSSPTKPMPMCTRGPPRRRSSPPFPTAPSTTSSRASGPAGPSRAWRGCCAKRRPARGSSSRSPTTRPVLKSGIAQAFDDAGNPSASHPAFRPHLMQGWSPDFVSRLMHDVVAAKLVDEVVGVNGAEALRLTRELATREGIFCGISGGATLAGALDVCRRAPPDSRVLCMLPGHGRAIPEHAALRGHSRGHDRRGTRPVRIDPGIPLRRAAESAGRRTPRRRRPPIRRRPPPSS